MMTKKDIVLKLKATLELRNEADAKVAEADTEEAALDTIIKENGWDAHELMEQAYRR